MKRKLNIVLIVLDSVRRDHLSCYGYRRLTTPHIDRIAQSSILYSRATATSCWTLPTHASLFTGLYPSQHRVDLHNRELPADCRTIADVLRRDGYATASISCNGFISRSTGLTHGFDTAVDVQRLRGGRRGVLSKVVRGLHRRWRRHTARDRGARRATAQASRWLRRRARDNRPFFLFLNYMDCHQPYRLRKRERHKFLDAAERERADAVPQDPFGVMAGKVALHKRDLELLQGLYDGCLHYLDGQVGQLDSVLRELGLADETILIVTSDHGESFGEHGLMDHQYGLYEHLLAVPLIIRVPGSFGTGVVDDRLAQHVDVLPTLEEILELSPVQDEERYSWSLFDTVQRPSSIAEYLVPNVAAIRRRYPDADVSRFDVAARSISTERFKLIRFSDGRTRLYDLDRDPDELTDFGDERPGVEEKLSDQLDRLVDLWSGGALCDFAADGDDGLDEVRDRLEALGYL